MSFTERQAIEMEMQELKETARREFEMYFESKQWRNQRYKELQERLRELDEKAETSPDSIKPIFTSIPRNPATTILSTGNCDTQTVEELPEVHNMDIQIEIPQWETTETPEQQKLAEEMNEEKTKTKRKKQVPIERIIPLVVDYLTVKGHAKTKQIKDYVETNTGGYWKNFNTIMYRVLERTDKVEKFGKGKYRYVHDENKETA